MAGVDVQPRPQTTPRAYDVTVRAGAGEHRFIAGRAGEGWPADVDSSNVRQIWKSSLPPASRMGRGSGSARRGSAGSTSRPRRNHQTVRSRHLERTDTCADAPGANTRWTRATFTVAEAALSGTTPTVTPSNANWLSRNATASVCRAPRTARVSGPTDAQRGPMSARHIVDSNAFLDAYAIAVAERRGTQSSVLVHRLWSDPLETLRDTIAPALNNNDVRWAVTGVAASVLLAPYLSDVTTLELYVEQELSTDQSRLASLLGGRVVGEATASKPANFQRR